MSATATGPRTEAGKAVSRFNPLRHGLTSQHLILPGENPDDFHALHYEIRRAWAPANPDEESLVAKIAEGEWRMIRARRVETATLKLYMERILAEDPQTEPDYDRVLALVHERYGRELDRLRRYETTISRALARTLRELEQLVNARVHDETVEEEFVSQHSDPLIPMTTAHPDHPAHVAKSGLATVIEAPIHNDSFVPDGCCGS